MNRRPNLVAALLLCLLSTAWSQTDPRADPPIDSPAGVTISLRDRKVTDKAVQVRYEIANHSGRDIWICESLNPVMDYECYIPYDENGLVVRRRLDVLPHIDWYEDWELIGRYRRMTSGQSRVESLCLSIPVKAAVVYNSLIKFDRARANHLTIEIGFYDGDLPNKLLRGYRARNEPDPFGTPGLPPWIRPWRGHTISRESVWDRDNVVLLGNTYPSGPRDHALRLEIGDLSIPYVGPFDETPRERPDLTHCTRMQVAYEPSMLEYLFPYADQQSLLSAEERRLFQEKTIGVVRGESIRALAAEVAEARSSGICLAGNSAHVKCYSGDAPLASLTIYGANRLLVDGREQFVRPSGFKALWTFPGSIQAFESRVRCAWNLRKLWYRLRPYSDVDNPGPADPVCAGGWPPAAEWCDAIVQAYENAATGRIITEPFICPTAGEGRCHYAMNPNCRHDSPGDTVLLFETKAGWNQCGGPELFSVDNHDPRGGCVLLNDGTVKFVRTPEELRRLRWQ